MDIKDHQQAAKYWNFDKNNAEGLLFDEITPGSGKKVWWKCEKGHEWQATVYNVLGNNSGCPYCSGRKAIPGDNDLLTSMPSLANEWNYEKNANILPQDFTPGSGKKVWWKCEKGHEWQADIHSRAAGAGCPYCAGKKTLRGFNDLATTHPRLLKEWDFEKNGDTSPYDVSFGSEKKVWWKCEKGHEWQAMVGDRVRGRNCPYCSRRRVLEGVNTLDVTKPNIAKFWNNERNTDISVTEITEGSGKKVWWKCEKGHEWQATPYNVAKGRGCPFCSNRIVLKGFNDLETLNPDIAKEWNYEKNGELKPSEIIAGSTKIVWWKCRKGHEWQARVYSRNQNHSCPFCNLYKITSIPEKAIAYYLIQNNIAIEENKQIQGKKNVDIYIPSLRIAIEYDGQYWHRSIERDIEKNDICEKAGIKLIRIREPKLPRLNSTSVDYIVKKVDNNYRYMNDVIAWIFSYIGAPTEPINIEDKIQDIYNYYNKQIADNSIVKTHPEIALDWDYDKNTININTISRGSDIKVWWRCKKCGYEWKQSVSNRCASSGCPRCKSTKLIPGFNDLATTRKDLLGLWNYNKNTMLPSEISAGSNKKVWWICDKGHEWQASAHNISKGQRCPYCAGKRH